MRNFRHMSRHIFYSLGLLVYSANVTQGKKCVKSISTVCLSAVNVYIDWINKVQSLQVDVETRYC